MGNTEKARDQRRPHAIHERVQSVFQRNTGLACVSKSDVVVIGDEGVRQDFGQSPRRKRMRYPPLCRLLGAEATTGGSNGQLRRNLVIAHNAGDFLHKSWRIHQIGSPRGRNHGEAIGGARHTRANIPEDVFRLGRGDLDTGQHSDRVVSEGDTRHDPGAFGHHARAQF